MTVSMNTGSGYCPYCGAADGEPCREESTDMVRYMPHAERMHPSGDCGEHDPDIVQAKPVSICIKWNNAAANDPCAICGMRTDPVCGPELFLDGTWSLVCVGCANWYCPELLEVYNREYERLLRRVWLAESPT